MNFDYFESKILKIKPDLSKKSVKVYVNTINKIIKDLKGCEDLKCLEDDKKVIKYLNGLNVSYLTVRNYYNTIIVFLQALNYPDELIKKYQDNRLPNIYSLPYEVKGTNNKKCNLAPNTFFNHTRYNVKNL